ncbi:MAG: type II 3-dehydroquinate dehydratase [Pseudomonadota bacterium]|nr:type II 3-dehydroquinate dehydratase [Pseudomonadota bacterium]
MTTTKAIYVLNGPNLNRLGQREPEIYGTLTLADIEANCRSEAADASVEFRQSNSESQLIDWIHEAIDHGSGIMINPAAYSFTSIAILDALKMFGGPIVEIHISNIHKREEHYHHSYVSKIATAVIAGLGPEGYVVGMRAIRGMIARVSS